MYIRVTTPFGDTLPAAQGRVRLSERHLSEPKELSLPDHIETTLWEQPWFCPIDPLPIAELTETSAREIQARPGGPFTPYQKCD